MSTICFTGSRVNFNSNIRLSMHSNKMVRAWQTLRQHWLIMLSRKTKENNKKKVMEDVGVMNITQELVELRCKVWVLIPASLTQMVQHST